jgi:hypothetical protein
MSVKILRLLTKDGGKVNDMRYDCSLYHTIQTLTFPPVPACVVMLAVLRYTVQWLGSSSHVLSARHFRCLWLFQVQV